MLKLVIYTDGGARGNPGPAASAFWIPDLEYGWSKFLGHATNNEAEYQAVIAALEHALDIGVEHIEIRSDSLLVVNQMNFVWAAKNERLIDLHFRAAKLAGEFESFSIQHIKREYNTDADRIYNECMDQALGFTSA